MTGSSLLGGYIFVLVLIKIFKNGFFRHLELKKLLTPPLAGQALLVDMVVVVFAGDRDIPKGTVFSFMLELGVYETWFSAARTQK